MSNKLLKIFLVVALILVFQITYVSASDVNLNLPGTDANQVVDNPVNNENVENTDNNQNDINNQGDLNEADLAGVENLQPTMVSSSQSGLSVSNIINILLITVGVILILLAIAIMIRLK